MLADLRDAMRQLRKAPGFALTAVITLALGIGATTAIFTLVHQVLLKSLPVTRPDELWRIGDKLLCCNWGGYTQGEANDFSLFSWEAYQHYRKGTPEFTDLAAIQAGNAPLGVRRAGAASQPDTRNGEYVSGNFFRTFGVRPWIGRLMTDDDDRQGAAPVTVMSYHVWQQKYGSDPTVVGAGYEINGHPFTVIGVAAPGFYGAKLTGWGMPDFWLPLNTERLIDGSVSRLKSPNTNFLDLIGRVKPGVNPQTLEAKLRVELHDWLASHVSDMSPQEKQLWQQQTLHLVPGGAGIADMRDQYKDGLKLLLIAAACVLLVACGNLANLMLGRGLKERGQTSVRVALGASWARLVRKAFVECILLSVIGGALGIAVAYAGTRLILYLAFHSAEATNYIPVSASPSWPVLLFALVISMLTGVLFGIAPAWAASRADPIEALRGANRSVGGKGSWAQRSLVIAQAAMSLVLLSAAALLGQSLRNLEHQHFGFQTDGRYIASINPTLGNAKAEDMNMTFRRIDDRLRQIPGVRSVAPVLYAPMTGDNWSEGVRVEGRPEPGPKEDTGASWARAVPGFFETLGAPIVLGRSFSDEDTAATRNVAVVNETFVKRFFKNQNPIGQHFGLNKIKYASKLEIVGVVRDMRYVPWDYKQPIYPMFWVSEAQTVKLDEPDFQAGEAYSHFLYNIVIWAPGNPPGMEEKVRKALGEVDPDLVLYSVDSYSKILDGDFQRENMIATLTTLFGALGLLLAAIGLYGVMSYSVEQRTSEIGVRMALGADRNRVLAMVLRTGLTQTGIGLGFGIPAAILAGHFMSDQLFGVRPWDPVMLSLATVSLGTAAILASFIPARRAAGVEPMVALRNE
jgi:putative ABC transport system permease protein